MPVVVALGILVHGANHFIVRGPLPSTARARWLVRQWELPDLLHPPLTDPRWRISTREFREDLQWAVVLDDGNPHTAAVTQLLDELNACGVAIHRSESPLLPLRSPVWAGED